MMIDRYSERIKVARLLRYAEPWSLFIVGLVWVGYLLSLLPPQTFTDSPATGGDTGSHFWPLVTLVNDSLPNFQVRTWNPGNLGGEPHLVHYFPLPYFFMAAFTLVVPIGAAFNIGTLLGSVLLPFGAIAATRGLGYRYGVSLIACLFTVMFLYNEGYTMWGGNVLSMLAGQFAHQYALFFLLCGVGALGTEIRRERFPLLSGVCFAGVATSHAYILLGLPAFAIAIVLFYPFLDLRRRLIKVITSGVISFLLSAWFLIPMVANSRWNTAFSMTWIFPDFWNEVTPPILYPPILFAVFSIMVVPFLLLTSRERRHFTLMLGIWILPALAYFGFYFLFPVLGLVDVRAIPQIQLFLVIVCAILYGEVLSRAGRLSAWLLTPMLVFASLWWTNKYVTKADAWLAWNYSGWATKRLHNDLEALVNNIRGTFSDPRVIFEHADYNNAAGTTRVFEMLPYFAGRATTESLYLQSTILSMEMFHLQFEVSKTPSCPLPELKCEAAQVDPSRHRMELMGVGDYILQSELVVDQARKTPWLIERGEFGPWKLFHSKTPPALVETFSAPPRIIEDSEWRKTFYDWFKVFTGGQSMLIAGEMLEPSQRRELEDIFLTLDYNRVCNPKLDVQVGHMTLETDCVGVPHFLKFAYHPTFKASSGDKLFVVSPGFIGIVPTQQVVDLKFGQSALWKVFDLISAASLLATIGASLWFWKNRRKARARSNNNP